VPVQCACQCARSSSKRSSSGPRFARPVSRLVGWPGVFNDWTAARSLRTAEGSLLVEFVATTGAIDLLDGPSFAQERHGSDPSRTKRFISNP
jgi:hypothetical protein